MIVYLIIVLFILFLLLQEKNQKKQAKGALNARSSRTGAAPFGNPRHASPQALEHLNLNPDLVRNVPISDQMGSTQRTDGRKSGHFRLVVKTLGPCISGRGYIRGTACKKSPLYRLLFALFLPNQEKGNKNLSMVNDHLSFLFPLKKCRIYAIIYS